MKSIDVLPPNQTFGDHLQELRRRIICCVLSLTIGTGIGYLFYGHIIQLLAKPLNEPLFYTSPTGGFEFAVRVSIFFGFLFSLPVIIFQCLEFVEPAIETKFKKKIPVIVLSSIILMSLGILFAYFVSLPATLYFLKTFGTGPVKSLITVDEYFSFITRSLLGFGIVFQLPLFFLLINWVRPLPVKQLFRFKNQRYVIVLSFILAVILTPTPNALSQTLTALLLIALYEFSVFCVWLVNKGK